MKADLSIIGSHCATMTVDTTVASDTIVAFVIPLVALLTSLPVMWHKAHLSWNFCVGLLQRVYLFILVC
jgi:hypothetical protein